MKTKKLIVDNGVNKIEVYSQAVEKLMSGEVVAFPTETVYGLGAIATNEQAVAKIFEAKGRPSDNPLIVHVGKAHDIVKYVTSVPEKADACIKAFWPGPLTLILDAKPNTFAPNVTAGLSTVGLRMPDHPVALELLTMLNHPVAAPSANRSGKPSPTTALHVEKDLNGRIPLILDGGATGIGLESTVVDFTVDPPVILRPGGVTANMLQEVIGKVIEPETTKVDEASVPRAPGMKYAHYAPDAPVYLIQPDVNSVKKAIQTIHMNHQKVALLATDEFSQGGADWFFSLGNQQNLETSAQHLYAHLRSCDETTADMILVTVPEKTGVGAAIFNRLEKAADGNWWHS
ncbi:Sua5/YciO/YrdC/YwlC family protein [Paenisporosarcina sp. HGH0030]|uniref:L-threonylcarbamoyladenylate synthase n=1 Tax=Paenisporosarcina sp. HGH0030 TaxID=1078085 RepID=UPI00034E0D23|nr:L-threonylcarbamoyladenylate synthase [Paenisporosarcina sp. HGH0030]EPD51647.1 Sua5/YciO/YrdC/YwlC family protein [Paenisporosarcina sp. HGH0030]